MAGAWPVIVYLEAGAESVVEKLTKSTGRSRDEHNVERYALVAVRGVLRSKIKLGEIYKG